MRASITWSVLVLSVSVASPKSPARRTPSGLFFEADMVRHALEGQAGPFCVLANQFKRKEAVAWRIRVLDQTGQQMDDKTLKSVVVELSDGQKLNAKFGGHPPRGTPGFCIIGFRGLPRSLVSWRLLSPQSGPFTGPALRLGPSLPRPAPVPPTSFPPFFTSSARASGVAGTSRPSALAVLRLIASSNLVGACTGEVGRLLALEDAIEWPAARRNWSSRSAP